MMQYPYLPQGREISYVPEDNDMLQEAKKLWEASGCLKQRTGAVVVKNGEVIGRGSNTTLVRVDVCPRDEQNFKTGEGYHLCHDVCHQVAGHSESSAVKEAMSNKYDTKGADLYLYGHWWCCENCWKAMIDGGIQNVYLLEGANADTVW